MPISALFQSRAGFSRSIIPPANANPVPADEHFTG
jgi:hypothetical protein